MLYKAHQIKFRMEKEERNLAVIIWKVFRRCKVPRIVPTKCVLTNILTPGLSLPIFWKYTFSVYASSQLFLYEPVVSLHESIYYVYEVIPCVAIAYFLSIVDISETAYS